jgi:hypothetical protein
MSTLRAMKEMLIRPPEILSVQTVVNGGIDRNGDTTLFWALPEPDLKHFSHEHRPVFAKSSTSGLRKPFPLPLHVRFFVPSRVSPFPVPRSHVSTRSFVFPRRTVPGRLHLPNSDARVPRLLHQQTDLPSVAFLSPCSPPVLLIARALPARSSYAVPGLESYKTL